jgi:hypothetical protein
MGVCEKLNILSRSRIKMILGVLGKGVIDYVTIILEHFNFISIIITIIINNKIILKVALNS